jgi:predicted ATPase
MRLLRVQVPEFRALKDVDISFEPEFNPQVFPLGSLNGGGKSTLLQLIFILLNIKANVNQMGTLENSHFRDLLLNLASETTINKESKILATLSLFDEKSKRIIVLNFVYTHISIDGDPLKKLREKQFVYFRYVLDSLDFRGAASFKESVDKSREMKSTLPTIDLINSISEHVFLISPSNQNYLFSSQQERRLLYTFDRDQTYDQVIRRLKNNFPTFFTYDFIDVLTEVFRLARDKDYNDRLKTGTYGTNSEQLENAINRLFIDGKKIIPLTIDQKRHTKDAIQSMGFQLPSGEEIYPEDLSHGELKRLAIFILLKYHEIQDSIILMDEIENGFHLDWQYNIVRDLIDWGQTNQYILATHSYELCTAVTPAHVKQIEPKLIAK